MKGVITSFVCLFCILSVIEAQTKWYVTPGAPVSGTGDSWANARDLQTAISNATAGDSVFVSQGTYQLAGGQSFIMKEGVKIYGRFAGTEASLHERNLYVTTASTLRGSGASVISNNGNGLTAAALLDGFTISNGTSSTGGGMYNGASSPTISNCIFTGNSGSGIYNTACSATIVNCIFSGNNTSGTIGSSPLSYAGGGGITNYNANGVTIANCIFYNNAGYLAGAIAVGDYSTSVTATRIYNCTIYNNNTTSINGCAIFFADAKNSQIKNCIIWGNTSAGTSNGIQKYAAPDYQFSELVNNNIIQRGYVANWDIDPQFINPANPIGADNIWGTADDGLRLQPASLACNNGTPDIIGLPVPGIDITGGLRVQDGRIDMGAYENTFACNASNTIYIDGGVTVSGDGSSWATAYRSYYHGLAAANRCPNVTSIMVAQGTYLPPVGSTFTMLPGIKIYGGFPTGGAPFNQRDPAAHATILRGSGNRVILNYKSLDTTGLLDGFTITGGVNAGPSSAGNATGGGIFNLNTNPHINNCIISDNSVDVPGGMGGGMFNTGSNPLITHCTFINNRAVSYGYPGGGGAIWNYLSAPTIRYCNFINNSTSYGGAVKNGTACYVEISNCIFTGNSTSADAGAIENNGAAVVKVINCTFVNNSAAGGGGGIDNYNSTLVLTNTLFWNNTAAHDADLWDEQNSVQATYNFFQSSRAGTGNIQGTASPLADVTTPAGADGIWYTGDDGLKLAAASVCLNAGTPDTTGLSIGNIDIASSNRIVGSGIDIGAYEYSNLSLPVRLISFRGNLENSIASLQWETADEWDFKQFDIEKSTDAVRFLHAGEVYAKGGGIYAHQVPQKEPVAYYRLKMVDINGRTTTSRTIRLTQKPINELLIYPNPATSHLRIGVTTAGYMSMYASNGVLVKKISLQAGINTIVVSDLNAGVYHIMVNGDRATFIKK